MNTWSALISVAMQRNLTNFSTPWNSKFVISATQVFRDHALNGVDQTKKKGGNKICNFMTDFRLTNYEKIICKTYPELWFQEELGNDKFITAGPCLAPCLNNFFATC